ncbi:MAG: OmpA family protein [Bacteroidetes bacterium]|nr:OmpA family protein [Bacteroidota bacterium]
MRKYLLPVLFLIILQAHGQQRKYSSNNPRAVRSFQNAIRCFDKHYDNKAIENLRDALKEDPRFVDAQIMMANVYEAQHQDIKAIESYRLAFKINPDYFPNSYLSVGRLEFRTLQYDSAKVHLQKFLSYAGIPAELSDKAKLLLKSCDFAMEAIRHPVPFNPLNMGDSINSADEEYFPAITADGKTFLFTRRLKTIDEFGHKKMQEDFYVSNFVKNHWTKAKPLEEINTTGNEGAPSLSADGQYLFFAACQDAGEPGDEGKYSGNRKGKGSCDIFISKKTGDQYNPPRNLESPINTGLWESQPSFSSDGRTLYFIRKAQSKDGKSNRDIYETRIDDSSHWSEPVRLSDSINTPGNEESVFIHPDNQTLYFSSDGHPGMGGLDIFMSKRQADGSWGVPVNLGYPINTADDENSLLVSPAGDVAYFASDRTGGKGGLDLYQFDLYPEARPEKITYMKGKVFDATSRQPLMANFELIDLASGKPVVRSTSNSGNGEFLVCVPAGKNYALNVSKDGYLFYSENFELKNPKNAKEPFLKDVPMHAIKAGESVILKNIFYDTDAFNIKDESKAELGKLILFLNKNLKVKIEISGHTDNVGSKQHNQTLSENRSKAVYDFLVTNKIPVTRLSFKGYGDTKPIASNDKEEGRAQNRRTEFVIVSVN